jgi:hypothetical protein
MRGCWLGTRGGTTSNGGDVALEERRDLHRIEPQPRAPAVADLTKPNGAELVGVLIHEGPTDSVPTGDLGRVQQATRRDRLASQLLDDAAGDRFRQGVELLG